MRRQPSSPARRPLPLFRRPRLGLEFLEEREVPATLSLGLANAALVENGPATTATLTRTGDLSQALTVAIANSDATEAAAPTSVVIAAGQASATFAVSPVDDTIVDGTQGVTLTATAATGPLTVRPDPTFGSGGYATTPAVRGGGSLNPGAVLLQPDGTIVAAASVHPDSHGWAIQFQTPNGAGGGTTYVFFNGYAQPGTVYALARQADGKILVAGDVRSGGVTDWALTRLHANGSHDHTFGNSGTLVIPHLGYDSIHDLEVAANGDILVGGHWGDSPDFRVTRLTANGAVIGSVDVPVRAPQPDERAYGIVADMALDANGKLLLAGTSTVYVASTGALKEQFSAVMRLNADLTPDATFGPGGVRALDGVDFGADRVDLAAVEAVGSNVVVAGTAWGTNQTNGRFAVARFNENGTLDTSFAGDGTATLNLNTGDLDNATAFDLAVQPDGKLVVAGEAWKTGNGTNQALARFNPNGTPDTRFNGTGYYVAPDYPQQAAFEQINAVALQPDGRLVAQSGGTIAVETSPGSGTYTNESRQWIARYDMATGEALSATAGLTVADDDPELTLSIAPASFSESGGTATATLTRTNLQMGSELVVTLTSSDTTEATVPTTVTFAAGQATVTFAVTGVDDDQPDGTQAVTISAAAGGLTATAGVSVTDDDPSNPTLIVTVDRTGVLEQTGANAAVGTVRRYGLPTAQALTVTLSSSDTTEATVPATVTIPAGALTATFPIATVDDAFADGSVAVTITASATSPGMSGPLSLDSSWGTSGYQSGYVRGRVAVAPDGKLISAGTVGTVGSNSDFSVRRFTTTGAVDTTFGSSGTATINPAGASDQVEAVVVQADGKVVVAGTGTSASELVVVRLNTNGTADTSFGSNGTRRFTFGGLTVSDVAVQADGKIVIAGSIGNDFTVVRLNTNGSLDSSFDGGVVRTTMSAAAKAYGVAVAPDGKIVAVGSDAEGLTFQRVVVMRFNTNGTPDATFGTNGIASATFTSHDERGTDVRVQPDGMILVGAQLKISGTSAYDYGVLRFNTDGTPDTSFGTAGRFVESAASTVGGPARIVLQSDGRVLLAGTAGVSGTFYVRFVRLTPAGVPENRSNGAWSVSSTEDMAQDAAGNVYLAYKYGSSGTSGYIDRYKSAGTTVFGQGGLNVLDNEPFAAAANSYTTTEETPLVVSAAAGVRANDTVTAPLSATSVTAEVVSNPTRGTLAFNADGSFTYTPQANFAGTDSFTYRLRDGVGVSNTATVTLGVTNVNDAPVAANDAYTVAEDTTLTVAAAAAQTALNMVSDAGDYIGQGRTYNLSPATGNFTVSGNPSYLTVRYQNPTNSSDYWNLQFRSPYDNVPLAAGQYLGAQRAAFRTAGNPGMDITGQHRGSNTLTGFFTILQIEVGPTGQVTRFAADFEQHSEGGTPALRGSVRFNYAPNGAGVLANDADPDGDPLSAVLVSGPSHGQLALNANGTLTYTPDANYNGPDGFTYKANDGALDSNVATVNITVTAVNDPPVGANDEATTAEDTSVLIDVLANDTDPEGQALFVSASGLTPPSQGTAVVEGNRVRYTPPANWSGTASFTYRPGDTPGTAANGNVVLVLVTVTPTPDAPVAAPNSYTTDQGVTLTVSAPGVLGNDTDPDGDALTAAVVSNPANGVLTLSPNGSFTYAPNPAFFGTDSFTYAANDGTGLSATATVTLTVLRTNDPPVAVDDSATTNEDQQVGIDVIANDSDPNGDPIVAVVLTQGAYGTATYSNNDGRIYYLPRANWFGTDTFTYRAWDGRAYSEPATVTVTVLPVNDAPVARNDFFQTYEDTPRTVTVVEPNNPPGVLWNDTDAENDPLSVTLQSGPTGGTVVLNADGSFTYTPRANFNGNDQFYYRVSDGALSSVGLVSINVIAVNDPPVGNPDTVAATEDVTLDILQSMLLGNDTDPDGSVAAIGDFTQPAHGSLIRAASFAGLIYRPHGNYNGPDTFTYRPRDNGQLQGNEVTVTINVAAVNDAPVGVANTYTVAEDATLTVPAPGVLAGDSDAEGNPFTAMFLTAPAVGTLLYNQSGDGGFTYTPPANYAGTVTFTYRPVETGANGLAGNTTTVTINVTPVNDAPVANPDSYTVAEDGTLAVTPAPTFDQQSLLGGQHWSAGHSNVHLQQSVVAGQAGTLASFDLFVGYDSTPGASFDVFVHKGAPWQTDAPEFLTRLTVTQAMLNQWVTFDVTAANLGLAAGETFTIGTKNGSGNATVVASYSANGESYAPGKLWYNGLPASSGSTYNQDLKFRTRMVAPVGLLANDTDVDGNPLAAVLVSGPGHGTLSLAANGGFTYTPAANYFGPDSFTYKANDGALDSDVATVTVTVTGVNDAPTLDAPTNVTVAEDAGPQTLSLSGIGAGPGESQTLTVTATSSNTALIPNPAVDYTTPATGGTLTFTPAANASGTATITVSVSDGTLTATRSFTVTVTPVNDAPVATPDAAAVAEDGSVTVAVLANDTDVENNALTVTGAANGSNGTVTFTAAGVTYAPAANFSGSDSFTYTVSDGQGGTATGTVTVTVSAVNDPPTLGAIADVTVPEDGGPQTVTLGGIGAGPDESQALTVTATSSNAALVPTPAVTYTSPSATGSLTLTPAANAFGSAVITVTVSDGTLTATRQFTVTVTPVNDAPTLDSLTSVSVAEDSGPRAVVLSGIGAGPGETQALTVTATSSNTALIPTPAVTYTSPVATGTLTFTPAADASGSATITVTVSDGALTVSRQFTVTVAPVNDAPTLAPIANLSSLEDAGPRTVNLSGIGAGPNESQALTVTATSSNPGLIPNPAVSYTSPATTGSLTFTSAANASGSATITVTVSDGALTATRQFTVTVAPVNDAPSFTAGGNQSVVAGSGPRTVSGWATNLSRGPADEAGQSLAFIVTTTNPWLFASAPTVDANGTLRFLPEGSATGTATVTVVLKDTGGTADGGADTSAARAFTITVTPNGLPAGTGVRMVGSELVITGTDAADTVTVSPQGNKVKVVAKLNGQNYNQTFSGVTRVRVDARGGNDTINLSAIALPTWTDAGAGDDDVTGGGGADQIYLGAGNDVADGRGGNDLIAGGGGNDFVIGGVGVDDLYGGVGSDILVGGSAAVRNTSTDSLRKVLAEWNPASTGVGGYDDVRGRLLITDDGAADQFRGDDGIDWFWVGGVDLELDTPEQRN